jgi:hypothetical protein
MEENRTNLRCPAASRFPPDVAGAAVVEQQWRLAVEQHSDLLADVTGVDPTGDLDLQQVATITARLEGYVDRHRQEATHSTLSTQQVDSQTDGPTGVRSWFVSLLTRLFSGSFGFSTAPDTPSPETPDATRQYDVDRVHQLSRFFRALLEERKTTVAMNVGSSPETAAAD